MRKPLKVAAAKLREEPYTSIICYPRPSRAEIEKRVKELKKLDIATVEFLGEKQVFNTPILGKGCVGIVTVAYRNKEKMALKIRRVDADRARMHHEAAMLKKANLERVGPLLLAVSKNFLLMQFVDGSLFYEWLNKHRGKRLVRKVLRDVLEQCWRLDSAGLDHGELSHAPKHIIVNRKNVPVIVDFETASLNRKPSNVTSICHFLFISGFVAEMVNKKLGVKDEKKLVEALKSYKNARMRENFEKVLMVCNLSDDVAQ